MRVHRRVGGARTAAVVAAVAAALLASCGDDPESASSEPGGDATTSSASTTSVSSPGAVSSTGSWDEAALGPCGDLPNHRTRPLWLPGAVPDGLSLASGGTERYESQESSPTEAHAYTLLETAEGGVVRSSLRIIEGGAAAPHSQPVAEEPGLTSVRGEPGSIQTYVDRSNRPWVQALWTEGGRQWSASAGSDLGVDGLAVALEPLDLESGGVSDPTGRYQVVAGDVVAAGDRTVGRFTTSLALDPHGSDVDPLVLIQVDERGPGAFGPGGSLPGDPLSAVQVDGRWVVSSPMGASVGLEDGSSATALLRTSVALAQSQAGGSTTTLPGAVVITEQELRDIVLGIAAADAAAAGAVAIPSHWLDLSMTGIELCGSSTPG